MNHDHPEHRIQSAPSHAPTHAPLHGDPHGHTSTPLPFSDAELEDFHKSDIQAGKMVVILLTGIFLIGLVLYTIIAGITTFDYGPLA